MNNIFSFASFEADRDRHLLRNGNRRLKVERIPLELLFLLLEHRGKVVTREQIVDRLWGSDLVMDTERSINTATRKIRRALNDDARHPRFIETVVGKGYRFAASIDQTSETSATPVLFGLGTPNFSQAVSDKKHQVRLGGFLVEAGDGPPILTCEVAIGDTSIGRIPLVDLHFPSGMSFPLKMEDKFLMNLLGVRVSLTAKAAQALHACCISVLQNGLGVSTPTLETPIEQQGIGSSGADEIKSSSTSQATGRP